MINKHEGESMNSAPIICYEIFSRFLRKSNKTVEKGRFRAIYEIDQKEKKVKIILIQLTNQVCKTFTSNNPLYLYFIIL